MYHREPPHILMMMMIMALMMMMQMVVMMRMLMMMMVNIRKRTDKGTAGGLISRSLHLRLFSFYTQFLLGKAPVTNFEVNRVWVAVKSHKLFSENCFQCLSLFSSW